MFLVRRRRRSGMRTMFDSLVLLVQKVFQLAHLDLSSILPARSDKPRRTDCGTAEIAVRPERGDLLEVPRTLFVHFGIYLGDGKVAHLMPDILPVLTRDERWISSVVSNKRLLMGVLYRRASVRVDRLEDFIYGAPVVCVNAMDAKLGKQPLANEVVALRAEKLVGDIPYSLMWNNCEHFVTYCRYGTGVSQQTDQFCDRLKSIIRDQRSVLVTTGIGMVSLVFLGSTSSTALPCLLISFILWMAG